MTTIAYDGKTLAGDKQTTYGNTPVVCTKLQRIKWKGKEAILGSSGAVIDCDIVIDWIIKGEKGKPEITQDEFDLSILLVNSEGVHYMTEFPKWHHMGKVKWAIGSGSNYALGAMEAGKTAKEAIEIASRLDVHTGLGVDTMTLKGSK